MHQIDGKALPALIDKPKDQRPEIRAAAAHGLAHLGPSARGAVSDLIRALGDDDRRVRLSANPAKELKPPRNLKPNEVVPYTLQEESQNLAACDQIGGGKYNRSGARYEQLRARAMIMLFRHTALRVSDVATLPKLSVSWDQENTTWRALVRTQKTGERVYLPIPDTLKMALDALPPPRGAAHDCPYYYWNGKSSRRAVIGIAERTLEACLESRG